MTIRGRSIRSNVGLLGKLRIARRVGEVINNEVRRYQESKSGLKFLGSRLLIIGWHRMSQEQGTSQSEVVIYYQKIDDYSFSSNFYLNIGLVRQFG